VGIFLTFETLIVMVVLLSSIWFWVCKLRSDIEMELLCLESECKGGTAEECEDIRKPVGITVVDLLIYGPFSHNCLGDSRVARENESQRFSGTWSCCFDQTVLVVLDQLLVAGCDVRSIAMLG
jgi:hypothetical protein